MAETGNPQPGAPTRIMLRSERTEIDRAQAVVMGVMEQLNYPEASRFAVRLALEEALSNAIRHGHKGLPADTPVRLEFNARPDSIDLLVEDKGPGFDPDKIPDPTLDENLELPAGRGILLMRAYMSRVEFGPSGNLVRMHYKLPRK